MHLLRAHLTGPDLLGNTGGIQLRVLVEIHAVS
jgi:hypothetical protein